MQENNCLYINSMGLRKICNITSLNNDKFVNEYNFHTFNNNDVVFIKTDKIRALLKRIKQITKNIVMVIGSSDYTIPDDIFKNESEFINFINNKFIKRFYIQNCTYKHPKIINLPIGLDYHTMVNNDMWGPCLNPIMQEEILINIKNNSKPFDQRIIKCFANFHFQTNTKYGYDRINAINHINNNLIFYQNNKITRTETWINQVNYAFVISPHGNGLDCHRTWEALILGSIVIVKTSKLDDMYIDLPVLIVNEWCDINNDLLVNTINDFKNKKFNYDKLLLNYWFNEFNK